MDLLDNLLGKSKDGHRVLKAIWKLGSEQENCKELRMRSDNSTNHSK
jgi:hypothetical protein